MYGLSYPLVTFAMVLGIIILYVGFTYVPSLIPFLSASILAYLIMWLSLKVFARIEEKVNGTTEVESNKSNQVFDKMKVTR